MKTYAFTDIHGMGNHFDVMMNYIETQSNGDYKIFYLGDACDRGPDGYRIMKALLSNPQVVYIKGNHEDMFVKACHAFYDIAAEEGYSAAEYAKMINYDIWEVYPLNDDIRLAVANGGASTLNSWMIEGCSRRIVAQIADLPVKASIVMYNGENPRRIFDMCHAGCIEAEWDNDDVESMIWSRTHFSAKWDPADNIPHVLLHGHTPTMNLPLYTFDANEDDCADHCPATYSEATKVDLDTGTFFSKRAWIMDLDTLECFAFGPEGKEEE